MYIDTQIPLIIKAITWWRRGELNYVTPLIPRKLLKNREAQNGRVSEVAANLNVSGTRNFSVLREKSCELVANSRLDLPLERERNEGERDFNGDHRGVHRNAA